jgi:sensor histidine kinase regulating citrate/malate metabolism
VVLIAKKAVLKNKDGCLYDNTYYFFLSFPIATMILLSGLYFVVYKLSDKESLVVMLSVIPLIISEFVCYLVYDYIIEKNRNINLLQEEIYKTKLQIKEYDLYKQKYESSRIIMHDIKKHLGIIRNLGTNSERANKYIDDYLTKNDDKIIYTNNEVLNVILNEKATECKQKNIDFSINVSTNKINILSDNDIVTIFCNLIDNAIESCLNSNNKRILVDIYLTNGIFLTVNMVNSCDVPPKYRNNKLISSKKDVNNHGLGMLSIEKSINNCGGDIQYAYNSEEKTFSVTILINTKL